MGAQNHRHASGGDRPARTFIAMRTVFLEAAQVRMEADVENRESHRNEETQGDRHRQPASKNPAATAGDANEMVQDTLCTIKAKPASKRLDVTAGPKCAEIEGDG